MKMKLVVDAGASEVKIIYSLGRIIKDIKYLSFPSKVTTTSLTDSSGEFVQIGNEQRFLIGSSVVKEGTTISKMKVESLVPKVLATVGKIALREGIEEAINLDLILLLPLNEVNQESLEVELRESISQFIYCGKSYEVKLNSTQTYFEGFGLLAHFSSTMPLINQPKQTTALVILGFRNISLLILEEGTLNQKLSKSPKLGFYSCLEDTCNSASNIDPLQLLEVIKTKIKKEVGETGANVETGYSSYFDISLILNRTSPKFQNQVQSSLKTAISTAQTNYQNLVTEWLSENLPLQTKTLICAGGSLGFLNDELNSFAQTRKLQFENCYSLASSILLLEKDPQVRRTLIENSYPLRLADAFSLFKVKFDLN